MKKKFEYRVMPVIEESAGKADKRREALTDAGREGWELVAVDAVTGDPTLFHLYFNREAAQ